MPNNSGAIDLGSLPPKEQEALSELAEETGTEPAPEKVEVLTAFVVIVGRDGNPQVSLYENPTLDLLVQPTPDLVYGVLSTLQKDLASNELVQVIIPATAQSTVGLLQQQAQQAMEAQQASKIAQNLGNLRG